MGKPNEQYVESHQPKPELIEAASTPTARTELPSSAVSRGPHEGSWEPLAFSPNRVCRYHHQTPNPLLLLSLGKAHRNLLHVILCLILGRVSSCKTRTCMQPQGPQIPYLQPHRGWGWGWDADEDLQAARASGSQVGNFHPENWHPWVTLGHIHRDCSGTPCLGPAAPDTTWVRAGLTFIGCLPLTVLGVSLVQVGEAGTKLQDAM